MASDIAMWHVMFQYDMWFFNMTFDIMIRNVKYNIFVSIWCVMFQYDMWYFKVLVCDVSIWYVMFQYYIWCLKMKCDVIICNVQYGIFVSVRCLCFHMVFDAMICNIQYNIFISIERMVFQYVKVKFSVWWT